MSYEKIAAASPVPATINFYYKIDDLFNDISLRSMYQSRNKKDGEGNSLLDEFSITEDERDLFLGLVEDAVYDVFLTFLKYTKAITAPAIFHNIAYTPAGGSAANTSGVKIVNYEAYNQNYLVAMDKNLFKAIRFYTLRDFAITQGLDDDAKKFDILYTLARNNISKIGLQLKKPLIS